MDLMLSLYKLYCLGDFVAVYVLQNYKIFFVIHNILQLSMIFSHAVCKKYKLFKYIVRRRHRFLNKKFAKKNAALYLHNKKYYSN